MSGWLVTCLNKLLETLDLLYVTVHLGCVCVWGGGAAEVRRDEVLPSMGILREGIPAPEFTSPMRPKRNKMH